MSIPTGSHLCPRSLDCAQAGRHFCQPGSSHCGACLRPLVENSRGRCVVRRRHAPHATQSTKGKRLFQFHHIGPSHLVFMALCCNEHKIIFQRNDQFFFFYWPRVLFRKKKTIGHCEAIEIHDFYFRKKKKKELLCDVPYTDYLFTFQNIQLFILYYIYI